MAQSTIIQVTVDYIGNTPMGGVARGLDVQNFAGPVTVGPLGTYIRYVEGGAYSIKQNEPTAVQTYIVQESLAAIALVGEGMVVLTVERFGKTFNIGTILPVAEQMLFDVNKFANDAAPQTVADGSTGCEFYYRSTGAADPIYYLVQESLSAIIASVPVGPPGQITGTLTAPFIPYATAASTLGNSGLSYDLANTAVRLASGVKLASATNAKAELENTAVDEWTMSTDGGTGAESSLFMDPASVILENLAGGGVSVLSLNANAAGEAELKGTNKVYLNTPLIETQDAGAFDVDTPAGTYSMFGTNASIVTIGKAGGTLNVPSGTLFSANMVVNANVDADTFSAAGSPGIDFSGAVTNITVVKGIVTAAS